MESAELTATVGVDPVKEAYDLAAATWDSITRGDHYDRWVGVYRDLLRRHGAPGRRIVDLGCGTGEAALRLARAGFQVTGLDLSPRMVEVAAGKPGADRVHFVVADIADLPDLGPFDAAVMLGEPLNYLADEERLLAAFAGVARVLGPGGLLVFDVNTAAFHLALSATVRVAEDEAALAAGPGLGLGPGLGYGPAGLPPARAGGAGSGAREGLYRTPDEPRRTGRRPAHAFSYFAPRTIERLLAASGLRRVAQYGLCGQGLHADADGADRTRIIVARKPARPREG